MALCRIRSCLLRCALLVVIARAEEVYNTTPPSTVIEASFSCVDRPMGFYADVGASCKVYHMCDDHGNRFSYRCPEETAFRQAASVCDHAYLVDCRATVYPSVSRPPDGRNVDQEASSTRSPIASSPGDDRRPSSFSRSFQVVRPPDRSTPDRPQSGFVFRASLFLRDHQDRNQAGRIADTCARCDARDPARGTFAKQFDPWTPRDDESRQSLSSSAETRTHDKGTMYLDRSYESPSDSSPARASEGNRQSSREKSLLSSSHNDFHPYSETLLSIQRAGARHATRVEPTTETPVRALTLSLKPLVPNALEYDPYYPKQSTSTEAYYTPGDRDGVGDTYVRFSSRAPLIIARPNPPFEIPSVLPDLDALQDLVDRRRLFYIPRTNVKST